MCNWYIGDVYGCETNRMTYRTYNEAADAIMEMIEENIPEDATEEEAEAARGNNDYNIISLHKDAEGKRKQHCIALKVHRIRLRTDAEHIYATLAGHDRGVDPYHIAWAREKAEAYRLSFLDGSRW
jgi:hypothetical protein